MSMLPSAIVLGLAAIIAFAFTRARPISTDDVARRDAALGLALATGIQGAHFAEEVATGLHQQLPALLGLPAMPFPVFLVFNVGWLALWAASIPGLRTGRPTALFAAWFLAIGGVFNGIAHPLLAIAAGAYFPGVVTAPFIGIAGALLWKRLRAATQPVVLV